MHRNPHSLARGTARFDHARNARADTHLPPPKSRTLRPAPRDDPGASGYSLAELSASLPVSPDDVPLEVEDLAPHFLFEATQSSVPSSNPPAPALTGAEPDAALREAFFEGHERELEQLREFERIWKHIIRRELVSTEL